MSMQIMASWLILCSFVLFFNSCVSFSFDSLKDKRAKDVTFQSPPASYKEVKKEGMDRAWESVEDRSTLSFFSNCSGVVRFTPLTQFQKELLGDLKTFQLQNQIEVKHQGQKAFHSLMSELDAGSQTMNMELFVFKKDNCFYVLSFLKSLMKEDNTDQKQVFENFIKGFHAP